MNDLTNAQIERATGGPIPWPDHSAQPVQFAAVYRFVNEALVLTLGRAAALEANLLGRYADTGFRDRMSQGAKIYQHWATAQRAAGKSETDAALRATARMEAATISGQPDRV
jgi:hypothetical protein